MPDTPRRIAAVILAAGGSSRLGEAKQLVEYRGEALVRRAARIAIEAGASAAIVVLGARANAVGEALLDLPGVRAVSNEKWADGLASSLALGLREVARSNGTFDGALISTVDQPLLDLVALRSLIDAFDDHHRLVAAEYAETIGVPAVVGHEYFDELELLTGDAGAGRWLRSRGEAVRRIPIPDAAVDIDDADDLKRLFSLLQG